MTVPLSRRPAFGLRVPGSWLPTVAFVLSLCIFEWIWGARFYSRTDFVGHDFALAAIGQIEGKYWIDSNGLVAGFLNPPWFSPAWCAGGAFYADPQVPFYSPLQVFSLWLDPFAATHASLLLFASVAFWGGYAVARRLFGQAPEVAVVFAVLGMANAFLPLRSAVGESSYQALSLWTLLLLALASPRKDGWRAVAMPALGAALCLSGWLQFGFGSMMVPMFMGTAGLALVLVLMRRLSLVSLLARMACGGLMAVVLNASKLYESISLMRNFPRDFYALPGFPSLGDSVVAMLMALIQPSSWTAFYAVRRLAHVRFTALPHEWALQFGWGAWLLALSGLCVWWWKRRRRQPLELARVRLGAGQWVAALGLALLCALPILLMWDFAPLRDLFKRVPILNSAAWPMRWIVVVLPLTQWLLASLIQLGFRALGGNRPALALAAAAVVWLGPLTEPLAYYLDPGIQHYDPTPARDAFARSRVSGQQPIDNIELPAQGEGLPLNRNDSMLRGSSQGLCYNPLYGYRLEAFPQLERLSGGDPLGVAAGGQSRINNPACLVHPESNQCKPGDGFRMSDPSQARQARRFVDRQPFEWQRPALGVWLSYVSQASWSLLILGGLALLISAGLRRVRARTRSPEDR